MYRDGGRLCVYVCLSVHRHVPTLLHGLGCNFVEWQGVPSSYDYMATGYKDVIIVYRTAPFQMTMTFSNLLQAFSKAIRTVTVLMQPLPPPPIRPSQRSKLPHFYQSVVCRKCKSYRTFCAYCRVFRRSFDICCLKRSLITKRNCSRFDFNNKTKKRQPVTY